LYTPIRFCLAFDGYAGLGGERTINRRVNILVAKGFIKFNREERETEKTKYGVMCVEGMEIPAEEEVNPETGEMIPLMKRLLPTHFKDSQTGAILPVENPDVWVYSEG
jgi:putative DNA primase/helicase